MYPNNKPVLTSRYNEDGPLTAGVHFELGHQGLQAINIIIGGQAPQAKFLLKSLLYHGQA